MVTTCFVTSIATILFFQLLLVLLCYQYLIIFVLFLLLLFFCDVFGIPARFALLLGVGIWLTRVIDLLTKAPGASK